MKLFDSSNLLAFNYKITIKNVEQQKIYNHFLVAKICGQLLLLIGLLFIAWK